MKNQNTDPEQELQADNGPDKLDAESYTVTILCLLGLLFVLGYEEICKRWKSRGKA